MLGRKKGGPRPSSSQPPPSQPPPPSIRVHAVDGALIGSTTESGQEITVSEFISQLDEAARKRLDRMNQRMRRLELQMETLEAEVGKASSHSYE